MPKSARPAVDPFGLLSRVMRFAVGLAILATLFGGGGAIAAPHNGELSQSELEAMLANEKGPLRSFIDRVERSLASGEMADAESMVDREALLNRATRQITFAGDQAVRDLFCDSTKRTWDERGVTRDYAGSKFTFLRARTLAGRAGLLFRATKHGGGINYALFTVTESTPGSFRITDIFVVGLNEFLSDTLRRTWVNIAVGLLGKEAQGTEAVNPAYVANIGEVANLSRQMQAGKPEEVLRGIQALPKTVQAARTVLLIRIEAGEALSIEEQDAAYAAWLAAYPDEMELPLKLLHFYSDHHRWNDAERLMRKLMTKLGEDAMLKMELGTILYRGQSEKELAGAAKLSAR